MHLNKKRRSFTITRAILTASLVILTASVFSSALAQAESRWCQMGSDTKASITDVRAVPSTNVFAITDDGSIVDRSQQPQPLAMKHSPESTVTSTFMMSYEVFFTEPSYGVNGSGTDFFTTINISPIELFFGAQFVLEWDCTLFELLTGWTRNNGHGQLYNGSTWVKATGVGLNPTGNNPQCPDPTQGRANFLIDWGNYAGLTMDGLGLTATREGTLVTIRWRTYSDSAYNSGTTGIDFAPTLKLVGIKDGVYEYTGTVGWTDTLVTISGTNSVTATPTSSSTPTPTPTPTPTATVSPILSPSATASPTPTVSITPTVSLTPAPESTETATTPTGYGSGETSTPEGEGGETAGATAATGDAAGGDGEVTEEDEGTGSPARIRWWVFGAIIALSVCLLIVACYVVKGARRKWSSR